jgi:O-methyltransferase involved in polyketide biosynthesis
LAQPIDGQSSYQLTERAGVTQYLTEPGVRKTLDFLARAAGGSRLAFTYVRKDFLEGKD